MPSSRDSLPIVPVIAIHGGAGTIRAAELSDEMARRYHQALHDALRAGQQVLLAGGDSLQAACAAVQSMESCPLFNAGHGAVFTAAQTHELDAAVMDGPTLRAGAVAGVTRVRHPVLAAHAVMQDGAHVLLAGAGADDFARSAGLEMVEPDFFSTEARRAQLHRARATGRTVLDHSGAAAGNGPIDEARKLGTVGAVALDAQGRLAAATSTGGMTNKRVGRVGDSPLIGAGTYADDQAAVSCTGTGEMFIRVAAAHDVCARLRYAGQTLQQATDAVIAAVGRIGGEGGLIAIDRHGNCCLPFNSQGMYRGVARGDGVPWTAIHRAVSP